MINLLLPSLFPKFDDRNSWLIYAELIVALSEAALFLTVFGNREPKKPYDQLRDFVVVFLANAFSFGIGEVLWIILEY